jgi:hypothetical protein
MTNETIATINKLNFVKKVFFAGFKAGVAVSILFYLTYLALSRS